MKTNIAYFDYSFVKSFILLFKQVLSLLKQLLQCVSLDINKLVGVGPIYNRPSTDELHHFVNFF